MSGFRAVVCVPIAAMSMGEIKGSGCVASKALSKAYFNHLPCHPRENTWSTPPPNQ